MATAYGYGYGKDAYTYGRPVEARRRSPATDTRLTVPAYDGPVRDQSCDGGLASAGQFAARSFASRCRPVWTLFCGLRPAMRRPSARPQSSPNDRLMSSAKPPSFTSNRSSSVADSNNYRVLGATPEASPQDLRRNMALLMTWLHPDKNPSGERAVLAARVTAAWDTLRSPDRRAAYDASLLASRATASPSKGRSKPGAPPPRVARRNSPTE